jgi:hypothetical protein
MDIFSCDERDERFMCVNFPPLVRGGIKGEVENVI